MSTILSRLVACLVAVVAVLQLVHLVLLNQLENRRLNQLTQIQNQFHPLTQEEYDNVVVGSGKSLQKRKRKLDGYRRDFYENELLLSRLFNEDKTIVDSTGEYRVVFDLAGPSRDAIIQSQTQHPSSQAQLPQTKLGNNDDFSIDDDDQEPPAAEDLTLVTYGELQTAKRYLIPLTERWNGPISFVVFARNASTIEATLDVIAHVRLCSDVVRQYVNFHVVFPLVETNERWSYKSRRKNNNNNNTTQRNRRIGINLETECQGFLHYSNSLSKTNEMTTDPTSSVHQVTGPYPTNLLRNVGRKRALTDYSVVIPIDMLPSDGLRSKFYKMVKGKRKEEEKIVFVIASFETREKEQVPGEKRELIKLLQKYEARPYHFELCWKCQVLTDYESWAHELEKGDQLSLTYEVLWKDPWEPFFISSNSVPLFDEGFRHPTYDRLSQLCELHVAGYKFAVLNEPFLVHSGYITPTPFHLRDNSNADGMRARFRQFKQELKNRYPHSTRRCY